MKRGILWILFLASLIVLLFLIFRKVDQKPLPESLVLPTESIEVLVFFGNTKGDPDTLNCDVTYSAVRSVLLSGNKYKTVLAELLQGPSDREKEQGFFTAINPGVKLPAITFVGGALTVDFADDLEKAVGGSCRVAAIRSQIVNTLKQFSEVKEVIISVSGRADDILQP